MSNQKSYITHPEIAELETIEKVDYWIDKYLEDYYDDEPRHIKWRLDSLRLLWKRRKEISIRK